MNNRYDHLRDKLDFISKDALLHDEGANDMIQLDPTNPHHVEWFEEKSGLERMKEIARRAMAEGNFTINDLDKALMELRLEEHRKNMTEEKKTQAIRAGGSLKTIHNIDAQAICRELRGKV